MISEQAAKLIMAEPAARDFVADAFAHMKFIGHTPPATAWFEKAGIGEKRDEGFIALNNESDCSAFVSACRQVRYWDRARIRLQRAVPEAAGTKFEGRRTDDD